MTDTPDAADANAEPSEPSGSTDADEEPAPRRRSRWALELVAGALALLLVAVALVGRGVLGWWAPADDPVAEATPEPTEPAVVSPFDGTPAESFAEGADGIVLPEAEAIGDFTAEEVADALEQVRQALIAARLDHTMLIDHDPDPFLATLAPDHQQARRLEFDAGEFGTYATQVSEDAALAAVAPRVDGRISYGTTTVERGLTVIEVVTAFVWVYAFDLSESEADTRIVVIRDELVWEVSDEPWVESSRGPWLASTAAGVWGSDCDAFDESLVKPAPAAAADLGEDTATIFDPEQPLEPAGGC